LWHSDDGDGWSELVGAGPGEPLLALAELPEGGLLAGTTTGAVRGDGSGSWERLGPPTAVISLAVSREQQGLWAFGASPGGLWWTDDGGARWTQVIEVPGGVGSVLAP
jgi:hypothetical protein